MVSDVSPRIVLHFHPGWPFGDGTVIEAIVSSGVYRSQFETGISNGGLTAHAGGARWRWENQLFTGRYDSAGHVPLSGGVLDTVRVSGSDHAVMSSGLATSSSDRLATSAMERSDR
jgi:hypothetical protein